MRHATLIVAVGLLTAHAAGMTAGQQVGRTAEVTKRGFTEADFPRVQKLAPNVYSYEALRSGGDERFTTVSLFVVTAAGVLVADGQGNAAETKRMVDEIAKITPRPIAHVIVCSDHGDHTAGNGSFPAGATFYAHPTSKAVLEASAGRGGRGDTPPVPVPSQVVTDKTVLTLGGMEIQLLFLGRAHTGGDLSVYLPKERILFMSEAYLNRVFPAMRSAYPSEWVAVVERAQKMPVDIFVPGHGFVETPAILKEELETYKQALRQVIAEAKRLYDAKMDVETAVKDAKFGDLETWTLHAGQRGIAVRRVYLELDGKLPK
ncbi:MAG TPA: MBL fold metallo-hydrolase [Vicinamibacterales bacterium]|nr:MBL fold metallo-hydrolase [Vicinamibacterales bacterium]